MMKNTLEHRRVAKAALKIIKSDYTEADLIILMLAMNIAFCDGRIIGFDGVITK